MVDNTFWILFDYFFKGEKKSAVRSCTVTISMMVGYIAVAVAVVGVALEPMGAPDRFSGGSREVSLARNDRETLIETNIGANDRRTSISNFSEVFSSEMQVNLERVSGQVTCKIDKMSQVAEARLIEDGQQIITNAHVFADNDFPISNVLPSCTFTTKAKPDRRIDLDLREGSYRFFSMNPRKDRRNDVALVRLKKSIDGVKIPVIGSAPAVGETMYLVTSEAEDSIRPVDSHQLVAQNCTTMTIRPSTPTAIGFFTNDCSSLPGDSGATYYVIRNGETRAVGFEVAGGWVTANRRPYDIANRDPQLRSFSAGLIYDQRLLEASRSLARRANKMTNDDVSHIRR